MIGLQLRNNQTNQSGFSLVELVLVTGVVILLGFLIGSLSSPISSINKSRHTSMAREIASKQIEYLRKQNYENLPNGINSFSDPNLSKLPSSFASYEIEDCPLDLCVNGEKIKRIRVEVGWIESGEDKKVELFTLVGEGGLGQ